MPHAMSAAWRAAARLPAGRPACGFLTQVRWRPTELDVFAVRLDYPSYGFFDRRTIRPIMSIASRPTAARRPW